MKSGVVIIATGGIMVACGLMLFYTVHSPQMESLFRTIKHAGTFIGLLGIGVTLAGILLYLINRNQPQIQEQDI